MVRRITTSLLLLVALAGCSTVSSRDYAVLREELRTDPQARRAAIADCTKDFAKGSPSDRQNLAALAGTSAARAPAVACERIFRAIASGRISHEDFTASRGDYSKWIAVMRG